MSRSYKKPIFSDRCCAACKLAHRRMRRATRDAIQKQEWDDVPLDEAQLVNDFDVHDMRIDNRWERDMKTDDVAKLTRK